MQITTIKEDSHGFKLIAVQPIFNIRKSRPMKGSCYLFDYKNGVLTYYSCNHKTEFFLPTFKAALKFILSY